MQAGAALWGEGGGPPPSTPACILEVTSYCGGRVGILLCKGYTLRVPVLSQSSGWGLLQRVVKHVCL